MLFTARFSGVKYMAKQFLAKLLEQKVLCFKMCVEGGSANIGSLNDFANRNLMIMLFRQKLGKGVKNGFSGLSLPSVHVFLHTISGICSVLNDSHKRYVDFIFVFKYTFVIQYVR